MDSKPISIRYCCILWAIGIFIVAMLVTMCKQWIDNLKEGVEQ